MGDCKRFDEIQLRALLGEATGKERRWASTHARTCDDCREQAARDRGIETAVRTGEKEADRGFRSARARLARTLDERRAWCARVDGPFGPVLLASSPAGLCLVSFRRSEDSFIDELERIELLPEFAPERLDREVRQLEDYFAGRLKRFRLPVDLRSITAFQRKVLDAAATIPFGQVVSYGEIAREIGKPGASRAVGNALGRNPVPIVVPCHRVIAAGGAPGGYTGGVRIKRALMRIEGIQLQKNLTFG
jgi:methylated-DNA-[protein]-cysteine S-methyltransferase